MGYYNTFVVKIWCDESREMTRGHIQHVSTQELTYFLNLERMTDFIISHLSPPPSNSVTECKAPGGLPLLAEGMGHIGQDE